MMVLLHYVVSVLIERFHLLFSVS